MEKKSMHFEILAEGLSDKKALDILVPKIIGNDNSCRIIRYKGVGNIPENMTTTQDARKRILLEQLPRLLRGYGNVFEKSGSPDAVIVVCDLDRRCQKEFREEVLGVVIETLKSYRKKLQVRFCIAVEEIEAWYLGDIHAVIEAYPNIKMTVVNRYVQDSVCGTWELLADSVYRGGHEALSQQGWMAVGAEKSEWAERISPLMDIDNNKSPSFQHFNKKIHELTSLHLEETCKGEIAYK
jgi:hypothetical protein